MKDEVKMPLKYCSCIPLAYMIKYRMMFAEDLLSAGERSIKKIASLLG